MTDTWRLDDARQTLVLCSTDGRCPQVIYWGAPLPAAEDMDALVAAQQADVTGGMLDQTPDLSICPEQGRTFPGQPGLTLRDEAGRPLLPRFDLVEVAQRDQALTITCADAG